MFLKISKSLLFPKNTICFRLIYYLARSYFGTSSLFIHKTFLIRGVLTFYEHRYLIWNFFFTSNFNLQIKMVKFILILLEIIFVAITTCSASNGNNGEGKGRIYRLFSLSKHNPYNIVQLQDSFTLDRSDRKLWKVRISKLRDMT